MPEKQIHRSMEQNKQPRNKHIHIWSIRLQQRGKNIQWIKASSTNDIVKTGELHAKESDLISHAIYRNKLKMDEM